MAYALLWIGLVLALTLFYAVILGVVGDYNNQVRRMHEELMAHMREHHPDVAPRIELTRIGPFFARGAFRPSILYARSRPDLNDPKAEELLAEYARLTQLSSLFVLFKERLRAIGSWVDRR